MQAWWTNFLRKRAMTVLNIGKLTPSTRIYDDARQIFNFAGHGISERVAKLRLTMFLPDKEEEVFDGSPEMLVAYRRRRS